MFLKMEEKAKETMDFAKYRVYYPVVAGGLACLPTITAFAAEGDVSTDRDVAASLATSFQAMADTMIDTIFAVLPVVLSIMSAYLCIKFGISFFRKFTSS